MREIFKSLRESHSVKKLPPVNGKAYPTQLFLNLSDSESSQGHSQANKRPQKPNHDNRGKHGVKRGPGKSGVGNSCVNGENIQELATGEERLWVFVIRQAITDYKDMLDCLSKGRHGFAGKTMRARYDGKQIQLYDILKLHDWFTSDHLKYIVECLCIDYDKFIANIKRHVLADVEEIKDAFK